MACLCSAYSLCGNEVYIITFVYLVLVFERFLQKGMYTTRESLLNQSVHPIPRAISYS